MLFGDWSRHRTLQFRFLIKLRGHGDTRTRVMGKVSTDLAPCHLAHLSPERLIVPSQQEAADCPKQIESNFEH